MTDSRPMSVQIATLPRAGCTELFATAKAAPGEAVESLLQRLAGAVAQCSANIIALDIFGCPASPERLLPILAGIFGTSAFPVTCLLAADSALDRPRAAQVWAISGVPVQPIIIDGRTLGATFADAAARYVRLGGVLPADTSLSPAVQARQVLESMDATLRTCGLDFRHVVRTWFYNRDILAWYDEFNAVRNAFFADRHIDRTRLPASTGVGAQPPGGAALVGGLFAVEPLRAGALEIAAVPSPRQGPAAAYGSSFSRAIEIAASDHRRLLISGTASIGRDGASLEPGEISGQIAQTLDIVQHLLESRGMQWPDVVRGVAHFRRPADIPAFRECLARRAMPAIHMAPVISTICRDELLFELEIDAARPRAPQRRATLSPLPPETPVAQGNQ